MSENVKAEGVENTQAQQAQVEASKVETNEENLTEEQLEALTAPQVETKQEETKPEAVIESTPITPPEKTEEKVDDAPPAVEGAPALETKEEKVEEKVPEPKKEEAPATPAASGNIYDALVKECLARGMTIEQILRSVQSVPAPAAQPAGPAVVHFPPAGPAPETEGVAVAGQVHVARTQVAPHTWNRQTPKGRDAKPTKEEIIAVLPEYGKPGMTNNQIRTALGMLQGPGKTHLHQTMQALWYAGLVHCYKTEGSTANFYTKPKPQQQQA